MKKIKSDYLYLMLALFGAIALSILLFFILFRMSGIRTVLNTVMNALMPFIVGGVIAHILKPSCNFIERELGKFFQKRGKSHDKLVPGLSVVITLLLALLVIAILLAMVLPALLDSIASVIKLIPDSIEDISNFLLQFAGDNVTLSNYITELSDSFSSTLRNWVTAVVMPNIETLIGGVSTGVQNIVVVFKNLLIGIVAAIYILLSRKKFAEQAKTLNYSIFGKKWSNIILNEFRYADKVFGGFINGRLIDALIIGVICFIGMLILRLPYPVLVSVIVGVTNIIPFFGPYIGMIPSFLLILMVNPVKSVIFLVFVIILQQFDGNILGPKILGDVTGLSSFWVLFSILFFGGLYGFLGMIIGVPVFAIIYDIICKLVRKGVAYHSRKEREDVDDTPEGAKKDIEISD
ncbi:MAG: AI-2E family transporter [Clostridiales bacterium]|nr:AI-2E family transporter [Clostridiales bacterium]